MSDTGVEFTAGLGGFLVLFGLALTVWFLGRDLTRRLRRMRQQEARRVAEDPPPDGPPPPPDVPPASPGPAAPGR